MYFTLTVFSYRAPDESEAHHCWRSLVDRLRYREQLGAYGCVTARAVTLKKTSSGVTG